MSGPSAPSRSLLITALLGAGVVSGCGSLAPGKDRFGCQGQPGHPLCLPTSAVYALTESSEPIPSHAEAPEPHERLAFRSDNTVSSDAEPTALELFTGEASVPPGGRADRPTVASNPLQSEGPEPLPAGTDEPLLLPRSTDPLPLRLPAQVMRIWFAPWEDDRGDLHASGYLFTEIVPRTWTLAEGPAHVSNAVLRPLQTAERSTAGPARVSLPDATGPDPRSTPTPRSHP